MSDELELPTALDALQGLFSADVPAHADQLAQVLRALQRLGLRREELLVHVERIRAINEVTSDSPTTEDACLIALDIIAGTQRESLAWSPSEAAAAWLPRTLTAAAIANSLPFALSPSDLLPPDRSCPPATLCQLGWPLASIRPCKRGHTFRNGRPFTAPHGQV